MNNLKTSYLIFLLILQALSSYAQDKTIRFSFTSPQAVDIEVKPATLKYDKHFALSMVFDDGLKCAYELAYRLMAGGTSEVDQRTYPGLFYTDGCGTKIPFTASVSWYTANSAGIDVHINNSSLFMSWQNAIELLSAGWTFMNHSYDQSAYDPAINYFEQLDQNNRYFRTKTGTTLWYVVPPSGDPLYIQPAFEYGAPAVFTSSASYTLFGNQAAPVDQNVTGGKPVFWRDLLNSDTETAEEMIRRTDSIVALTNPGKHLWINEFTHRVQYDPYPASMTFEDFRSYMEHMERVYGYRGFDNGLFASPVEVFEYLVVRNLIKIRKTTIGNRVTITADFSDCPNYLQHYDISLIVSGGYIQDLEYQDPATVSFANKETNTYLINLDLPDSHFSATNLSFAPAFSCEMYPNPATNEIRLRSSEPFPENVTFILSDLSGRVINTEVRHLNSFEKVVLPTQNNPTSGLYILKATYQNRVILHEKIILMN